MIKQIILVTHSHDSLWSSFSSVFSLVIGGFVGAFIALWLDKELRSPKLQLTTGKTANSDNTYPSGHQKMGERWKFFRIAVKNIPLSKILGFITNRQTAENCSAELVFFKKGNEHKLFSMKGRWASTPEIPYIGTNAIIKLLYPDPVSIAVGQPLEFLDIMTQYDKEPYAWAWNNESYVHNWRHPQRKLLPGRYIIQARISTQNGISFIKKFHLTVSKSIDKTKLTNFEV